MSIRFQDSRLLQKSLIVLDAKAASTLKRSTHKHYVEFLHVLVLVKGVTRWALFFCRCVAAAGKGIAAWPAGLGPNTGFEFSHSFSPSSLADILLKCTCHSWEKFCADKAVGVLSPQGKHLSLWRLLVPWLVKCKHHETAQLPLNGVDSKFLPLVWASTGNAQQRKAARPGSFKFKKRRQQRTQVVRFFPSTEVPALAAGLHQDGCHSVWRCGAPSLLSGVPLPAAILQAPHHQVQERRASIWLCFVVVLTYPTALARLGQGQGQPPHGEDAES